MSEESYNRARTTAEKELTGISDEALRAVFDAAFTELAVRYSWETVAHSVGLMIDRDLRKEVEAVQIERLERSLDGGE